MIDIVINIKNKSFQLKTFLKKINDVKVYFTTLFSVFNWWIFSIIIIITERD